MFRCWLDITTAMKVHMRESGRPFCRCEWTYPDKPEVFNSGDERRKQLRQAVQSSTVQTLYLGESYE
jgi:hypothetical protein